MRGGPALFCELFCRVDVNATTRGNANSQATQMAAAFMHSWLRMQGVISSFEVDWNSHRNLYKTALIMHEEAAI